MQGLNILLNLFRAKLAAVILGPEGIGLNAIFNETRELIHESTNIGLDKSGVREIARAYDGEIGNQEKQEAVDDAIALTRSWVLLLASAGTLITIILAKPLSLFTFSSTDYTWGYVLLSPAVGFSTMTCGELVVLRGIHRLKKIASVSLLHVLCGVVTTIPIYYLWGMRGVVPALDLMTFSMMVVTMAISYRIQPPRFCFQKDYLGRGKRMLTIGLSFVVASFIAHGSRLIIQAYLNNQASLSEVGLYNAGYTLAMVYTAMLFASLDTDYFPRLSAVFNYQQKRLRTIQKQIDVTLTIIFPVIIGMVFSMPIIVPLFLSNEFVGIIPMAQVISLSLLFRAMYLPMAILPLSAGDSHIYLMMQLISYLGIIPFVLFGYDQGGLLGAGMGWFAANLYDMLCSLLLARLKYHVYPSRASFFCLLLYIIAVIAAYVLATETSGINYCTVGITFCALTTLYAYFTIRKKWSANE